MAKTLQHLVAKLKHRAHKEGPAAAAAFDGLDRHFAAVAQQLEALRIEQNVPQRELARRSRIHQAEVSRILSGRTQPLISTAGRLAQALGAELRVVQTAAAKRIPTGKSASARVARKKAAKRK